MADYSTSYLFLYAPKTYSSHLSFFLVGTHPNSYFSVPGRCFRWLPPVARFSIHISWSFLFVFSRLSQIYFLSYIWLWIWIYSMLFIQIASEAFSCSFPTDTVLTLLQLRQEMIPTWPTRELFCYLKCVYGREARLRRCQVDLPASLKPSYNCWGMYHWRR